MADLAAVLANRKASAPMNELLHLALRLADNVHTIATHEAAGDIYHDISELVSDIERCINRPEPDPECGPCNAILTDGSYGQKECRTQLTAKRGDTHTTCPNCHTTHKIDDLINHHLKAAGHMLFTAPDLLQILHRIGEPIGQSTWRRWRATGRISPAGELYGQCAYKLDDARQLRRRHAKEHI
jgi:LSD1 subclass zinc finger protein